MSGNTAVVQVCGTYEDLLDSVPTMTEAIRRCFLLAGKCDKEAAFAVGVDYCHFQRMLRSTDARHFQPDKIELLMNKMGNRFPLDWLAHRMGLVCYPLEVVQILEGIRDVLRGDKDARFAALLGDDQWAIFMD